MTERSSAKRTTSAACAEELIWGRFRSAKAIQRSKARTETMSAVLPGITIHRCADAFQKVRQRARPLSAALSAVPELLQNHIQSAQSAVTKKSVRCAVKIQTFRQ